MKQPDRLPTDGAVNILRNDDGHYVLSCMSSGVVGIIIMSPYNAWRAFGMLAIMLGLPLSKKVGKAIVLTHKDGDDGFSATLGTPPDATLGERAAAHLTDLAMEETWKNRPSQVERALRLSKTADPQLAEMRLRTWLREAAPTMPASRKAWVESMPDDLRALFEDDDA